LRPGAPRWRLKKLSVPRQSRSVAGAARAVRWPRGYRYTNQIATKVSLPAATGIVCGP
jgi:hypothetical protein